MGLENKWSHNVNVSWIAGTAAGTTDSSLSRWLRKYSTATNEISADWKVADLVGEIIMLKVEWHAFECADGNPVTAPTLPPEWHTDTHKTESFWVQPLTNWTVANINKTLKPWLCAMIVEVLGRSCVIEVEARPQVDASERLQIDAALLTNVLAAEAGWQTGCTRGLHRAFCWELSEKNSTKDAGSACCRWAAPICCPSEPDPDASSVEPSPGTPLCD